MTPRPPGSTLFPYTTLFRSHTGQGKALFGAIGDSAPDRWGRMLMGRAERRAAKREKRTARTLREIDYLDRKSTRLNSSHLGISYAVFCLKKKNKKRFAHGDD